MKKLLALVLVALMLMPMTASLAATEFDVTEPITITWWHAHEDQLTEYLNYMVDKFNTENEMGITVEPVYIGSYDEINTQFIAAAAAGHRHRARPGYLQHLLPRQLWQGRPVRGAGSLHRRL